MKKTYKLMKAFIVLLSLATLKMGAALSGTVTINNLAPASSTNYQTFGAFATDINTNGVSGPLTVNVVALSGPYNEQVTFNQIVGMSAANRVTINGNGCLLTFNATSTAPHTMLLNGTDYLTVNNLQMQGTNSNYATVCLLASDANSNVFTACTFSCPANCTSSSTSPFSLSGSATGLSTSGTINNFNTCNTCTLSSGYYGIYIYGSGTTSQPHDNSFLNCYITDWYQYCVQAYYSKNLTIKGCTIDCATRTSLTSPYLVYGWYSQGFDFENNIVEKIFNGNTSTTNTLYGFYYMGYYNPAGQGVAPCKIINNIFRKIESNGPIYMHYYNYASDIWIMNNTYSFDHTASTSSSSMYVFYYCYGGNGEYATILNNNVSITRGGSGAKYGFYCPTSLTGAIVDYNNYYVNGLGTGANYIGYVTSPVNTLATWITQGVDAHGINFDPMFASLITNPQDQHPTNPLLNNKAQPIGLILDQQYAPRDLVTPDVGALEFGNPACTGIPTASTVNTPSYAICSGERLDLMLNNYTTNSAITYQWLVSNQSAVGPWTVIPGANTIIYSTPPNTSNLWYGVAQTCTNAVGSKTAVGAVVLSGPTTNTAPYFEGFEGIGKPNRLPNCSWLVPGLGGSAFTYTSSNTGGRQPRNGTSFASFYYSPTGVNYFYTNGIYMTAGITYNASVWYQSESVGYTNWTDLSLLYGTTQTPTGLVSIVSSNGPAVSSVYKQLTGNFTVPTTGMYYVTVAATSANGSAQYLTFDDLRVSIPCSINSPTVALTTNTTGVCAGDPVNLSATGASSYSWSNGATGPSITDNPTMPTTYIVYGTSLLSGCTSSVSQAIAVNPSPNVLVYATNPAVCNGQSTSLNAICSSLVTYAWSNNSIGQSINVTPTTANNTYVVLATNGYGCVGTATSVITVHALPNIGVGSVNDICAGDAQMLTATGGVSYVWVASNSGAVYQGNPVTVNPVVSTVYTVTGTDALGCSNKQTVSQNVNVCTGLAVNKLSGLSVYPNPTSGEIMVELNNTSAKTVLLMDLTGRIISSSTSSLEVVKVDLTNLSNGIYYLKIQSDSTVEVVKVVKQ